MNATALAAALTALLAAQAQHGCISISIAPMDCETPNLSLTDAIADAMGDKDAVVDAATMLIDIQPKLKVQQVTIYGPDGPEIILQVTGMEDES